MNVLDKTDLCGWFANSLDVHERRLFNADLHLAFVLSAEFLKQLLHPRQ